MVCNMQKKYGLWRKTLPLEVKNIIFTDNFSTRSIFFEIIYLLYVFVYNIYILYYMFWYLLILWVENDQENKAFCIFTYLIP